MLITYLRDSGFLYGEIKDIIEKYLVSTRNGRTKRIIVLLRSDNLIDCLTSTTNLFSRVVNLSSSMGIVLILVIVTLQESMVRQTDI